MIERGRERERQRERSPDVVVVTLPIFRRLSVEAPIPKV